MHDHHGIDDVDAAMAELGIEGHDPDDCEISSELWSALDADAVMVDGQTAWLRSAGTWFRYGLDPAHRERLLRGYDGGRITLVPSA